MGTLKYINTKDLRIAYEESGNVNGTTVILMHGFSYVTPVFNMVKSKLNIEIINYEDFQQ